MQPDLVCLSATDDDRIGRRREIKRLEMFKYYCRADITIKAGQRTPLSRRVSSRAVTTTKFVVKLRSQHTINVITIFFYFYYISRHMILPL